MNKLLLVQTVSLFFFIHSFFVKAQKITLAEAIHVAMQNNLEIKNEQLYIDKSKKLISTAFNIPSTHISLDIGNVNGALLDNRWSIQQSFSSPLLYGKQKKILKQNWKIATFNKTLKELEIKKNVTQIFYTLVCLEEKRKILTLLDSIHKKFISKINLLSAEGETDILVKLYSENERTTLLIKLNNLEQETSIAKKIFKTLLYTESELEPIVDNLKIETSFSKDDPTIENHISLQVKEEEKKIASMNSSLEKIKLFPEFSLAYFNGTFQGFAADNKEYTLQDRFQSVQIGIDFPLFFITNKKNIEVSYLHQKISQNNYLLQKQILKTQWTYTYEQYKKNKELLEYFEKITLPNIIIIESIAEKKFSVGEYLEWFNHINQVASIKISYIDIIKSLNENSIELEYLLEKK